MKTTYTANANLIQRDIAGEHLLIPVGEAALNIHGMITLTESGLILWNRLQTPAEEEDLINVLRSEYEVDETTARNDVRSFLQKLNQIGILVKETV